MIHRKVLLTLTALCLLASVSAKAQIYIGGHLGLDSNGDRIGINIAPDVGYAVNPYLTVGGNISYQSLYNTFGLTPYARCNAVTIANRVRFYAEATFPMRFSEGYSNFNAFLRPGVAVRVADTIWLMATIGAFGYSWVNSGNLSSSSWIAKVDANTVSIGFFIGL